MISVDCASSAEAEGAPAAPAISAAKVASAAIAALGDILVAERGRVRDREPAQYRADQTPAVETTSRRHPTHGGGSAQRLWSRAAAVTEAASGQHRHRY